MIDKSEYCEQLAIDIKDIIISLVTDYVDLATYTTNVSEDTLISLDATVDDLTYAIERYRKGMGGKH